MAGTNTLNGAVIPSAVAANCLCQRDTASLFGYPTKTASPSTTTGQRVHAPLRQAAIDPATASMANHGRMIHTNRSGAKGQTVTMAR